MIDMVVVPDIAVALKIIFELWKKNKFLASYSSRGKCLIWGVAT